MRDLEKLTKSYLSQELVCMGYCLFADSILPWNAVCSQHDDQLDDCLATVGVKLVPSKTSAPEAVCDSGDTPTTHCIPTNHDIKIPVFILLPRDENRCVGCRDCAASPEAHFLRI